MRRREKERSGNRRREREREREVLRELKEEERESERKLVCVSDVVEKMFIFKKNIRLFEKILSDFSINCLNSVLTYYLNISCIKNSHS